MKAVLAYLGKEKILCIFEFAEVLSSQIIIGSANRKEYMVRKWQIRKLLHLRKVRKSKKRLSPLICGLVICRTFLRTAHLCNLYIYVNIINKHLEEKNLGSGLHGGD
jgi:hypothetical protein